MYGEMENQVNCQSDGELATFCGRTCLLFILFLSFLSLIYSETCDVLPIRPLDDDTALWNLGSLYEAMHVADEGDGHPNTDISICM